VYFQFNPLLYARGKQVCGGICVVSLNDKYLKKQIEVGGFVAVSIYHH